MGARGRGRVDGGGGGNDRLQQPPKPPRPGGIPLPDAEQSPQRFRGPGRLADRYEWPVRRPAREPQRTPRARLGTLGTVPAVPEVAGPVDGEAHGEGRSAIIAEAEAAGHPTDA